MESSDLRIFQQVARHKSVSRAALAMGYVQSNVTLRIQKLETELGISLFHRSHTGVTLTSNGVKLLAYADQILQLMDEAKEVFSSPDLPMSLRIGGTQTVSASYLPAFFTAYHKAHPSVSLSIHTDHHAALMNKVVEGSLDGAFISDQYTHEQLTAAYTFAEEVGIIASREHHNLTELMQYPLIVNQQPGCPYRTLLERWAASHQGIPTMFIEFDTLEAILKGISEGLGISLLPRCVIPPSSSFQYIELPETYRTLTTQFVIRNQKNPPLALRNFIDILNMKKTLAKC
jgi:DNA-binding transcriptional LysR family regulator